MPRWNRDDLDAAECRHLLETGRIGRVGVTIDALPAVLLVDYVMQDGAIVFRTIPGTKLNAATADAVVAFLVDSYCQTSDEHGWSVLARGLATRITDLEEHLAAHRLPLESWALDGRADLFTRIEPTMLSGRRVNPPAGN